MMGKNARHVKLAVLSQLMSVRSTMFRLLRKPQ